MSNNKSEGVAKPHLEQHQPVQKRYMQCNGTATPARVLQPLYAVLCSTFTIKANAQQQYKFHTVSSKWSTGTTKLKELQSDNKHSSLPVHSTCHVMVQHHQQGLLCLNTVHATQWYAAPPARVLQPVNVLQYIYNKSKRTAVQVPHFIIILVNRA